MQPAELHVARQGPRTVGKNSVASTSLTTVDARPSTRLSTLLSGLTIVVAAASGLLGLFVGSDYLARTPFLPRWNGGYEVIRSLMGQGWPTELLQDYSGARAIVFGGNAYDTAGEEAARYAQFGYMGLPDVISTHPPSAFALFLPLAPVPFGMASAIWAALMLIALVVLVRLCGASWHVAALLGPLLVLAPPVAAAVNHLAVPWLVLLFLAFHVRHRPVTAGLLIGVASLTKYLPALVLAPLLLRRHWTALVAFVATWMVALGVVVALNPSVLPTYFAVARSAAGAWINDPGNGAFLIAPLRYGLVAEALAVALVGWILYREAADLRVRKINDYDQWARWNWLGVALLPITWTYSVLPLALSVVLLYRRRRTVPFVVGLAGLTPVVFTLDTTSPLPQLICIACVGVALCL